MERRALGSTGIEVSRMCVGTLTAGPLQTGMGPVRAADMFEAAVGMGVNFFDSAKIYGSHPHLRELLRRVPRGEVVIATKSYDYTYEGMRGSVEEALKDLGTDYIDIYLMHEQESRATLRGHEDGFKYLMDAKSEGVIRAIGVSTHACEVAEAAPELGFLDVLHPMLNRRGLGLIDGTIGRMEAAVARAHASGMGVYAMKVLGGGLMIGEIAGAIGWARSKPFLDSMALGVATEEELRIDVRLINGEPVSEDSLKASYKGKSIIVEQWCSGCGSCVASCKQRAIRIEGGRAVVDRGSCVLCGYCGRSCPDFHIRVV